MLLKLCNLCRKSAALLLPALLLGLCAPSRSAPTGSKDKLHKDSPAASTTAARAARQTSVRICFTEDPPPFPAEWLHPPEAISATCLNPDRYKDEIVRARRLVQEELTRYPTTLVDRDLRYVYIFKSLFEDDTEVGGLNSPEDKKLYLADVGAYSTSMERYIRASVHHEFSHVLLANYANRFPRGVWRSLNPPNFRYGDGGLASIRTDPNAGADLDPASWEEGFAYSYGKSDVDEDFACLSEAIFSGDARFWQATDRVDVLHKKVQMVIAFYHSLDVSLTEAYFRRLTPFPSATDPVLAARHAEDPDDEDDYPDSSPRTGARAVAFVFLGVFVVGGAALILGLVIVSARNSRSTRTAPAGPSPWLHSHLWYLVMQNDVVGTEDALTRGADANSCDANGAPLLVMALLDGHPKTAGILLRFHANVHLAAYGTGVTPLMAACRLGAQEIVMTLLAGGANVDVQSAEGACALGYAAHGGYTEIVSALLQRGANPHLMDRFGNTALLLARRQCEETTNPARKAAFAGVVDLLSR